MARPASACSVSSAASRLCEASTSPCNDLFGYTVSSYPTYLGHGMYSELYLITSVIEIKLFY